MMGAVPDGRQSPVPRPRRLTFRLTLLLYVVTISIAGVRKISGLPAGAESVVYLVVGAMYLLLLPGTGTFVRRMPLYLPAWLTLLTFWCVVEAFIPRIPLSMAALGVVSYVFFVPLIYIGAELMSTDIGAARTLRFVAIAGGLLGLGATVSAVLGQSAPAILQPITPGVGLHSSSLGNIYLAPSVFVSAEQAAEGLLISLFALIALGYLPSGRMGRIPIAVLGTLIAVGLFATQRRADLVVAILGVTSVALLGRQGAGKVGAGGPRTHGKTGFALALGSIGSLALLYFLGASRILPFLTSRSNGINALTLMFSPINPSSLTGQGTGTSTQGGSIFGATAFTGINNYQHYAGYIENGRAFITAEGGLTKTWLELGIVGVLLYGGVFFAALGPPIHAMRRLDGVGRALTVLTVALGIVFLKGHASLDDPLVQPLFWLAVGGVWGRLRQPASRSQPHVPRPAHQAPASGSLSSPTPRVPLG
jgi:hypothetical protein